MRAVSFERSSCNGVIQIEVFHKFAKLRNSAIMEENIRCSRGDFLCNSNVFFHNGGKLRNLANVKDLYRFVWRWNKKLFSVNGEILVIVVRLAESTVICFREHISP